MSGKGRRNKGQVGEREFFTAVNKYLPAHLHMTRDLSQTRDGGCDFLDDEVAVEVKRCQTLRLKPWLEELRKTVPGWVKPVIAYRQNNDWWHVLVDMDEVSFAAYRVFLDNKKTPRQTNGGAKKVDRIN
jgi:hypothetical protein